MSQNHSTNTFLNSKTAALYSATPAQKRLWVLDQLNPEDTSYNLLIAVKVSGPLQKNIFSQALNLVVHKHDSLRANILSDHEILQQHIAKHKPVQLNYLECADITEIQTLFKAEANDRFDLQNDNLFRFSLIKMDDYTHVFIANIHHIVTDGWSMSNFVRDLGQGYQGIANKNLSMMGTKSVDFGDIIQRKIDYLDSEKYQTELAYWTDQLKDSIPVLEFNHVKPAEKIEESGRRFFFKIDNDLLSRLKKLALEQGVTLNMLMMAQYYVLLHRYTQQTDISIGSPVAGRKSKEEFDSIGFFVNSIVFREHVKANLTFTEFLKSVKQTTINGMKYQDVPFINLVEAINPDRSLTTNPLYNVSFIFQNMQKPENQYADLSFELVNLDYFNDDEFAWLENNTGHSLFDLTLELIQTHKDTMVATFEYNTGLFAEHDIESMSAHYLNILRSLCDDAEQRIADVDFLTVTEKNKLMLDWNHSSLDFSECTMGKVAVHEYFEQQVEKTPDNIAAMFGDDQLTYRELNEQSNQLAHHLKAQGVVPDTIVGISISRSMEMLISIFGILKSGGCYLPMDPNYPEDRLFYMLEDSKAPILITTTDHLHKFQESETSILTLDTLGAELNNYSNTNIETGVTGSNLSFIIYTSGSTGLPKGVCLEHHNLSNLLLSMLHTPGMKETDRWLAVTATSFDIHTMELYLPLLSGATVVIASQEMTKDAVAIEQELIDKNITVMQATPVTWKMLMANNWQAKNPIRIISGGEAMGQTLIEHVASQDNIEVWNMYGPSETCVYSTRFHFPNGQQKEMLGQSIANTQLYVLDANKKLVPPGIIGELYIGGEGVTRGYLSGKIDRTEMTDERYIMHDFGDGNPVRLYQTGDEVRHHPNGMVEMLGRIDSQVKVRGFRIELGEIESQLNVLDSVKESVVIVKKDQSDTNQLVAYIIAHEQDETKQTVITKSIKNLISDELPIHMVPEHIVYVDHFPQTPSGKIDRKNLPDFTVKSTVDFVAPTIKLEIQLASIWSDVLKVEKIGVEDNFFELGGHSLLATQLISRITAELNVDIKLKTIFDRPTIAALASYLEESDDNYEHLRIEKSQVSNNQYPLSFSQYRLWFIQNLDKQSTAYIMPATFNLSGDLDEKVLEKSFLSVVQRHEVLRVNLIEQDEMVYQSVYETNSWALPVYDFSSYETEKKDKAIKSIINVQFNQPFDLAKDQLLRTQLIKTDVEHHILVVSMHHIISDGWSVNILMREISQFYQAFSNNTSIEMDHLSIQYTDYASWQQENLSGEYLDNELQYWKEKLKDIVTLELTTDYPRPVKKTFNGDSVKYHLDYELTGNLKKIVRQEDVTLFMTLLTGLNILLKKYSGQNDICIGSPIANRNRHDIEDLIGFFVNTLVFRQEIESDSTIKMLLQSVKITTLEAYEHQDTPFEKIVDVLDVDHSLSHTPLFQIMFVLQNQQIENIKLNDLDIEFLPHNNQTAKFDLTFNIEEVNDGLEINLEYNCDLFKKETIQILLKHYESALKSMTYDLEQNVDQISLLSLMEKKQILFDFNQSPSLVKSELCLHHFIEHHAIEIPDQKAVIFNDESITYQQLNQLSNQLAHCLVDKGVTQNSFVGIFISRSIDMVIAILATLKAGAAYVPIDPTYPDERIQYMQNDSQLSVVLTKESLQVRLLNEQSDETNCTKVFCLDTQWQMVSEYPSENMDLEFSSENLAYMIYTSGSTGQPKGVLCHHKGLVNLINDYNHKKPIEQGDHCSAWSTFSFDASVYELFTALTSGAVLHVLDESIRTDGQKVIEYLNDFKINHCFFPAVYLQQFALWVNEHPGQSSLKRIMTGVESIDESLLMGIQSNIGGLQIINSYGPTEATIICLAYLIDSKKSIEQCKGAAPIGTPVANSQIYILDEQRNPVPIGVNGEIYVGGEGVTHGYWNNESFTTEKFVPNIFAPNKSKTLYRTGDVARFLPDGKVQFVGRSDNQIKLRGYRIELGEIETHLKSLAEISETVVTVYEDDKKNKQLIAYVSTNQEMISPSTTLDNYYFRSLLSGLLSDYMIPSVFIVLDKFPLLPNGKLDKKSLPDASNFMANLREKIYAEPTTSEEIELVSIWSEFLLSKETMDDGFEKIGINDNFFELGGHSLIATQIITRINKAFNCNLQVMQLFEAPYIAQLAKLILTANSSESQDHLVPNNQVEQGENPLTFSQERFWFLDKYEPGNTAYNIPMALNISGNVNIDYLEKSFQAIIARHESLRTNFVENDYGQLSQNIHDSIDWKLNITDLQIHKEWEYDEVVSTLIHQMVNTSFNLENDQLFKATFVIKNDLESVLLLNIHHIIADGWSMGLMLKEVDILYRTFSDESLSNNIKSQLPALPVQYVDFAAFQRDQFSQGKMAHQLSYWQEKLQNVVVLELPIDKKRPSIQTYNGAHVDFSLSNILSDKVNDLCLQQQVSPFMFFLTALNVLLYRYTQQDDICIGTPIAGRNIEETENLIGLFVNTLALRNQLKSDASFTELLEQVKKNTLEAYAYQDAPFDQVVENLNLPRNLSTTSVFQVMLSMQSSLIDELRFSDLKIKPLFIENPTSKFDLLLDIGERDNQFNMEFEYNTDLFEHKTIQRTSEHFISLINSVCDSFYNKTSSIIKNINFLSDVEMKQLLHNWNDTKIDFFEEMAQETFFQLFSKQVQKTPDNIAVIFKDQKLTYRELDEQSSQLAHYFIDMGVSPGCIIGVSIERSIQLLVTLIAVMKSGAAYVPLDPDYPDDRLAYILEDSTTKFLITTNNFVNNFTDVDVVILNLDAISIKLSYFPKTSVNLDVLFPSQDIHHSLAYVIYTSGSTGLPKGVCIEHHNLSNFLLSMVKQPGIQSNDSLLAVTSTSFDIHTLELYTPLIVGGNVVIASQSMVKDAVAIKKAIMDKSISVMQATPATWKMLLANDWQAPHPIKVLCGGEAMSEVMKNALVSQENIELWNMYGPTETTVWSSVKRISSNREPVTIGGPIANTYFYVMDSNMNIVPSGIAGELYIGGKGVSRGYLSGKIDRAQLTDENFINHTFSDGKIHRLYRTGDECRYDSNGYLSILGRLDNQVKVNGFRIELGEIESLLNMDMSVDESVVIVKKESNDNNHLLAYIVLNDDKTMKDQAAQTLHLKQNILKKLPAYMVPVFFVYLDEFPLTPNGKIDKKALPDVLLIKKKDGIYEEPVSSVECELVKMWTDVLNVDNIGIKDDFFALGGNSLQASQIIAQIRTFYQVEVPVKSLFTEPTIAALSLLIDQGIASEQFIQEDVIQRSGRDGFDEEIDPDFDEEFELEELEEFEI